MLWLPEVKKSFAVQGTYRDVHIVSWGMAEMGIKSVGKQVLDRVVRRYGYRMVETPLLYSWQLSPQKDRSYNKMSLPDGAGEYLRLENPRLKELEEKYAQFDREVTAPLVWNDQHLQADDLRFFRGCNAYVWQLRGKNFTPLGYALTTYYVKATDDFHLLDRLTEDGYFGIHTFQISSRTVSRDLLDSILEINFLERNLNISRWAGLKIVDIGAGYGRLASRVLKALPDIKSYYCTDAVALSTFVSEYYLRFRKVDDKGVVVPLFDIEKVLERDPPDIAINVHSFPECSISAIQWWLKRLEKSGVRYLMVVPNALADSGECLITNQGQDFSHHIAKAGYTLISREPKYKDDVVQQFGIAPAVYYLFERR